MWVWSDQAREAEQRGMGGGGGYGGGYGRDMGPNAPSAAELEEDVAAIQKLLVRTKVRQCPPPYLFWRCLPAACLPPP
jgi:hypothetical protein